MKSITIQSLLAATLLLPFAVNATLIDGDIGITGSLIPTCSGGANPCTMDIADGLNFANDAGLVVGAAGDFASTVSFGDIVTMTDFVFDPFANVDPLWTVGGWSFGLETLNIVGQTPTSLLMFGAGTISGNGFENTSGFWSFSADAAFPDITFAWSSTAAAAPEPGILVLMGMGLMGGLGVRRLIRS